MYKKMIKRRETKSKGVNEQSRAKNRAYRISDMSDRWFFGMLSVQEAEDLLVNAPVGTFLIRSANSSYGNMIWSVRHFQI
jgi:hypothetical protein